MKRQGVVLSLLVVGLVIWFTGCDDCVSEEEFRSEMEKRQNEVDLLESDVAKLRRVDKDHDDEVNLEQLQLEIDALESKIAELLQADEGYEGEIDGLWIEIGKINSAIIEIQEEISVPPPPPPPSETIRVAAFNAGTFGMDKRNDPAVMGILVRIAREFDIMLVQELRYADEQTAYVFLDAINETGGPAYDFERSRRLGRTSYKEAYAYFYNTSTVDFIEGTDYVWDDTADDFVREPYIASFRSGSFDFTLVGIHADYDITGKTWDEIAKLPDVVDSVAAQNRDEGDIIILGDLNADGNCFKEGDYSNPLKAPEFYWVIDNDMDTTVAGSENTYDRIIMMDATYNSEYVYGSAAVFRFDQEYDPMTVSASEVSDHYPVYAEFRTDLPDDD